MVKIGTKFRNILAPGHVLRQGHMRRSFSEKWGRKGS